MLTTEYIEVPTMPYYEVFKGCFNNWDQYLIAYKVCEINVKYHRNNLN